VVAIKNGIKATLDNNKPPYLLLLPMGVIKLFNNNNKNKPFQKLGLTWDRDVAWMVPPLLLSIWLLLYDG